MMGRSAPKRDDLRFSRSLSFDCLSAAEIKLRSSKADFVLFLCSQFLTMADWTIYYYVTNKAQAPEPWKSSWVLKELLNHSRNTGKKVRSMPTLDTK